MPNAGNGAEKRPLSIEAAMTGVLTLLIDARERAISDDKNAPKTEVLLSGAGMAIEDIAVVTGKKYGAVRMAIRRGKAK